MNPYEKMATEIYFKSSVVPELEYPHLKVNAEVVGVTSVVAEFEYKFT